jgi:hypothetical protein
MDIRIVVIFIFFLEAGHYYGQDQNGCVKHFGTYPSMRNSREVELYDVIFIDSCAVNKNIFQWDEEYDGEFEKDTLQNGDIILSFYTSFVDVFGKLEKFPLTKLRLSGINYSNIEFMKVDFNKELIRNEGIVVEEARHILERIDPHDGSDGYAIANVAYELFLHAASGSKECLKQFSRFYNFFYEKIQDAEVNETLSSLKRLLRNNRIELYVE